MSIDLMFDSAGKPPAWNLADVTKLEEALEALQRRYELNIDHPGERPYIRNAIGSLWTALSFASADDKYQDEHPDSPSDDDLPS